MSPAARWKLRAEWFGAVVASTSPPALLFVNRALARGWGLSKSPRWEGSDPGHLSAPLEVQLALTRRCGAGCRSCYVDAVPGGPTLPLAEAKEVLERLAARGVFHVALGGGEPLEVPHLFEVAAHARACGLQPTLTTSGLKLTPALARRCEVFAQVNVSLDGIGADYLEARGFDGYPRAVQALRWLREVTPRVGINLVVTRQSFPHLGKMAALARQLRLNQLQLLRFKPQGRIGAETETLDSAQARALYPQVRWLSLRHRMRIKLDCSFGPMVFAHRPSLAAARFFGVVGCEGGNLFAAVGPSGDLTGCGFGGPVEGNVLDDAQPATAFRDGFSAYRQFAERAPEPCRSCRYLPLCKGGCRVVARAAGSWWDADPGCPLVEAHRRRIARVSERRPVTL